MKMKASSIEGVANRVLSATCALALAAAPLHPAVADSLILNDFERKPLVEEGLRKAGLSAGDNRMVTLWARLKAQELNDDAATAAAAASNSKQSKYKGFPELAASRMRVRSLQAYLDELQRDIFLNRQKFVQGYLGVFYSQRDAFQALILSTFPADDPVSLASKDAMVDEGNNVFEYAEELSSAIASKQQGAALEAYAKLALSYDRFLKAGDLYGKPPRKAAAVSTEASAVAAQMTSTSGSLGVAGAAAKQLQAELLVAQIEAEDKPEFLASAQRAKVVNDATAKLVPQYDPLTSTESLFKDTPLSSLRYSKLPPKLTDQVLVLAGPDKGRTGVVLSVKEESAIIKLDTKEVKVIDTAKIARTLV